MAESVVRKEAAAWTGECGEEGDGLSCLMAQTARGHRVLLAGLLAEIDLYPGQDRALSALWENGPQSQNALARILGIDVSTMTKMLQRLERSGFVSRSPSPSNGRISIVSTTPEGDALRPEIERVAAEVHRRLTHGLTPEQVETLSSLLSVVRANICREAGACAL
ncbi:MarR family transcriptional regulator [Planomonospora sp. ID67723]|uniref:MarR family winged helix-turn-helix transcriptional regulator n=1 Tax=Planomonospora sp. ID67723 TaxID=2738134 RepID=UPI0018C43209|nr:MarR family transcriptional regulator [Planomonospora sp. ID67723]MBG0827807.1 MarR family transcriptional regulator [Planomonospora sp. ID67723]